MTNTMLIALSKAVNAKAATAAREGLAVGSHNVDMTVRIHGSFTVAEDTTKTPTVSIPIKAVLALFIHHCGITREFAVAKLEQAMAEALSEGEHAASVLREMMPHIERIENTVVAPMLARMEKTPVKGAVKPNLTVEQLDLVAA